MLNSQPVLSQGLVRKEGGRETFYLYGLGLIGKYRAYHFDVRGSTVVLTDEKGKVVERFGYGPYGELVSGSEARTPFLFNGQFGVMSDGNGLYYMRARFYSPVIKRFVNQDVLIGNILEGQSLNRFAFVSGRPVSLVDPFGLAQKDLDRAIDIVKTFLPPIYNEQVKIKFGNALKWWNPRHWNYYLMGKSIDGYTISGNPIIILIDQDFSRNYNPRKLDGSRLRVGRLRDLLETVIHEYQHAFDYQRYNAVLYDYMFMNFTDRHASIYASSNFMANLFEEYMYLTEEQWQKVKEHVKNNPKHTMTKGCYDAWLNPFFEKGEDQ